MSLKRADEEFCKAQFDAFIKQFFAPSQVAWEEVARRNEPPDYYLLLENTKYAVEVTTLIELALVGTSSSLPHTVISAFLQQFVNEVEDVARTEGYLRGDYLVSFSTPIDDFAEGRDEIKAKLLAYIHNTSGLERASLEIVLERVVPQQRPQQCGIQKIGSKPNRVVAGGPVWVKWEGDAAKDICDLLNESLDIKADKLKDIAEPKILLLLDRYRFADRQMYKECVVHPASLTNFHTIFVVQGHKEGFTLHTHNRDWLS